MMAIYRIFGLVVAFPRPVPTLHGARIDKGSHAPDVQVLFGPVPPLPVMETVNDDLDLAWNAEGLTIAVDEVGRFLVREGHTIIADPYPGVSHAQVDLYLAGSIMGALLHQLGILPLHCNAFACGDSAVLLCGDSGAGKSTLAAWFETRGYPLLTDDVCAVTLMPRGRAIAHPGIPRLRLWSDALAAMERTGQAASPVPWAQGKFELEMRSTRATQPLPIAAIYHLCENKAETGFAITPLDGLTAADALTSSIYRRRIGDLVGQAPDYLRSTAALAAGTPVFRIDRTWGMEHFSGEAEQLADHAEILSEKLR